MAISIRIADPERDYERVAEILQHYDPNQPMTADVIRQWDSEAQEGMIRRRGVAVEDSGKIVGYSAVVHHSWAEEGVFFLWVMTDPPLRKQGIGQVLYDDALVFARQQGASKLNTDLFDNTPDSLRFAEKRGFKIWRHVFESSRDLRQNAIDESQFAGVIETLQAEGIRFFSLADVGNTTEAQRQLWEVNYQTYLDDPASSGTFPNFEEFQHIFATSKWFRPEGQILAADGDKYVGLSAVGYFELSNSAYNMMTGVIKDYRGRKIAQALKVLSLRAAKKWGVDYIRTNNDSENVAMLAINQKLGYVPQPGFYRLTKTLEA